MRLWTLSLPLVLAASLAAQSAPPAGMDPARLAKIGPRIKAFADQGEIAGAVTLAARNGKIVHFEATGYQDGLTRKPMTKDSIFQIMSMTKPIVCTAIMILASEGKLALVDPVEKHLPEFRGQQVIASRNADGSMTLRKPARAVTVRDLMTHTSGLPYGPPPGFGELAQRMDKSLADAVLLYSQIPLDFDPGSRWQYSNNGIAVLGRLIEVLSGQSFDSFMSERLFQPLGMKDTFFFAPEDKKPRIAAVHAHVDGKLAYSNPKTTLGGDALAYRPGAKYPAPEWGAYSTANDLFTFYEMTRNGGMHAGRRILPSAAVDVMTSVHTGHLQSGHMGGTAFGLGWEVVNQPAGELNFLSQGTYGHGGAFGTHGWIDKKRGIVGVWMVQGGQGAAAAKYAFMRMVAASVAE